MKKKTKKLSAAAESLLKPKQPCTYRAIWSEDNQEFVGLCAEFPSLSHLDKTEEQALDGIRALVADVVADAQREKIFDELASEAQKLGFEY